MDTKSVMKKQEFPGYWLTVEKYRKHWCTASVPSRNLPITERYWRYGFRKDENLANMSQIWDTEE
jgi:hypothetical protein